MAKEDKFQMSSGSEDDIDVPVKLPSIGLPTIDMPAFTFGNTGPRKENGKRRRFPTAVIDEDRDTEIVTHLAYREIVMLRVMNELTDKPEWERKVFDDNVVQKWRAEALRGYPQEITDRCLDYCIEELRERAQIYQERKLVRVYHSSGCVVKSDVAIPAEVKRSLRKAVKELEDIPLRLKDFHPGSDGKVVDLVHPSLFPLVYGVTNIIRYGKIKLEYSTSMSGKGEVVRFRQEEMDSNKYESIDINNFSANFQWLPCDVAFHNDGTTRIVSYVNNLHPQEHRDMYPVLEKLIDASIPLWNEVLSAWNEGARTRIDTKDYEWEYPRGHEAPDDWDSDPENINYDEEDYYERTERFERHTRILKYPEPKPYDSCSQTKFKNSQINLKRAFMKKGIQVIVKLANIELTPEKPCYEGGTWHVEGMLNEHICATSIYYYDCENVTDSRLAFRIRVPEEELMWEAHEQGDWENVEKICHIYNEESAVQTLGDVSTREDRLLAFSNVYQHRVSPFELRDRSKPGHRKIVALFLVDPYIRILSTANVPPQQQEWWAKYAYSASDRLRSLPNEVFENVVTSIDGCPYSLEKAKEYREKLMDERRADVCALNDAFAETVVSFCEH